jgi:hypothetical protein
MVRAVAVAVAVADVGVESAYLLLANHFAKCL